jgi:hypothetical protein
VELAALVACQAKHIKKLQAQLSNAGEILRQAGQEHCELQSDSQAEWYSPLL